MSVTIKNEDDEEQANKDPVTHANKNDGAPMPDADKDSNSEQGASGIKVTTSAENVKPADSVKGSQVKTSHAMNPPDLVDEGAGLNVDSLNEAATVPVSATGAVAAQTGSPDEKDFAYRVAAWFANIVHLLDEDEKREIVALKADLSKRFAKALASGGDVAAKGKKLEAEAAKKSKELKDKYLD